MRCVLKRFSVCTLFTNFLRFFTSQLVLPDPLYGLIHLRTIEMRITPPTDQFSLSDLAINYTSSGESTAHHFRSLPLIEAVRNARNKGITEYPLEIEREP